MPARTRRKRQIKQRQKTKRKPSKSLFSWTKYALIIFVVLIVFALYFLLKFLTSSWDGESKISVASYSNDQVKIVVFDPQLAEITEVIIPLETQVEVARDLGNWPIGSVWELGKQEKLNGKLLSETLTSYLKLPVTHWWDESLESVVNGGIFSAIGSSISSVSSTDMSFGDRVHLALFSIKVPNNNRSIIDLREYSYLSEKQLTDGGMGFVIEGKLPKDLLLLFSDNELASLRTTTLIIDQTNVFGVATNLGEVLEVMGTKVGSVNKEEAKDIDCVVSGNEDRVVERIANTFSCDIEKPDSKTNFDITMKIGERFADRF